MKRYIVDLKQEYGLQGGFLECIATEFPWDFKEQDPEWKRPALIVVPGGGYAMVSKREGEPIAVEFLARGFQVFILNYSVGGENGIPYPQQLIELGAAVDYVKKHASELGVNPEEVFAVGFSAGGHLVANLAVEYASISKKAGITLDCKPTAVGLAYPVISQKYEHKGSHLNLLYGYSDEAKEELLKTLNVNEAVTENTPPAFIWATAEDEVVPPANALSFAMALDKCGVLYELHIYPQGNHGLSTGSEEINPSLPYLKRVNRWMDDCAAFFRLYCQEKY